MHFIADENFPRSSVDYLREQGFDVKYIAQSNPGTTDLEILHKAHATKAIILTFDKDFGELIFRFSLRPPGGVVFFRLACYAPVEPALILLELMKQSKADFSFRISVIDSTGLRQRRY